MLVKPRCVLLACVFVFACGNKDGDGKNNRPGKTEPTIKLANAPKQLGPSPFPELKVTIGGKPVPIHSIHAYWVGEEAVKIEFSSVVRSCLQDPRMRTSPRGERYFKIWFGKQLNMKGEAAWAVVQSYFGGGTHRGKRGKTVTMSATPVRVGKYVRGVLELKQMGKRRRRRKQPAVELVVSGPFKAINCRVPKQGGFISATGDMTIDVAGTKAKIRGANVHIRGDTTRIELSTDPRSCRRSSGLGRASLKLFLKKNVVQRAVLRGTWFPTRMTEKAAKKHSLVVSVGKPDRNEVGVSIKGAFNIHNYPIALTGKITATLCK